MKILMQRIITGHEDQIAFQIPELYRDALWMFVKKHYKKYNDHYIVEIKTPHRPRTTGKHSQCNCLHGWISFFCIETGNDFHQVKMYIKKKAISRGYPPMLNEKGEMIYDLYGDVLPMSEADASVEQEILLIEEMQQLADEYNIRLPESELI